MAYVNVGVVTGSKIDAAESGAEPGRILQLVITDAPDAQNVESCQDGSEYNPPNGTRAIVVAAGEACKFAAALDDGIAPVMAAGGKRIYATDPDGEAEVAECRLHPTGKAEVFNANAHLTLQPDGTVLIDNPQAHVTMTPAGDVTVSNGSASFTMSATGQFTFHGVTSTFDHPVTMQKGVTIQAPNGGGASMAVTGSVDITGNVATTGSITATADVTGAGISLHTHTHSGVQTGTGSTNVPQ